jgi:hypothetical protein
MSKKSFILIILFVFILITGTLFYIYFFRQTVTPTNTNTIPTTEFPFGTTPDNKTNSINNDGGDNNTNNTNTNNTNGNTSGTSTDKIGNLYSKIRQIYQKPNSGAILTTKNTKNYLRFVDRATGNIYEYLISNDNSDLLRITNTTLPKIQESIWFNSGDKIILRYADSSNNIVSFLGKISTTSKDSVGEMLGNFLTPNQKQVVINPDNTNIFELLEKKDNSGSYGNMYSVSTSSNKKQIFDSQLSIWNISWPQNDIITFNTKPTYKDYGYLFFLNTKTYSFDRVLGDIIGLTTNINKDISLIAYSGLLVNSFKLDIYDIKNKESKNINLGTLSDKCTWSKLNSKHLYCAVPKNNPDGNYPDDWYKGNISFNDDFWMIDAEDGTTKLIYESMKEDNLTLDAFDLKLNSDDKYLVFTNKNDLSLWLLELPDTTTQTTPIQ